MCVYKYIYTHTYVYTYTHTHTYSSPYIHPAFNCVRVRMHMIYEHTTHPSSLLHSLRESTGLPQEFARGVGAHIRTQKRFRVHLIVEVNTNETFILAQFASHVHDLSAHSVIRDVK